MFLKNKGWIAQEFYNEYLELKCDIASFTRQLEYPRLDEDMRLYLEDQLDEKVDRMRFVLNELKSKGVNPEDLILLSLGVNIA